MKRSRFRAASLLAWLPVACLLAVTVASVPSPVPAAPQVSGSLSVSPNHYYGGEGVVFKGNVGRSGVRKIWLEINFNRPGDGWERVQGHSWKTASDGSFKFRFPARGMDDILIHVRSSSTTTPSVTMKAWEQQVALSLVPADDRFYDTAQCGGTFEQYIDYDTVSGEASTLVVDTSPYGNPVLKGRKLTLQKRVNGDGWQKVAGGEVGSDGKARFDLTISGSTPVVYRVREESWTKNGSKMGWFPSFPTYVDPLHRADPASGTTVGDPDPGGLNPTDLQVGWGLPGDPSVKKVIVAWNADGSTPPSPEAADGYDVLDPTTSFHATDLVPDSNYGFSVFTRSDEGVCAAAAESTGHTEPTPPVTDLTTNVSPNQVDLAWVLPALPADVLNQIDEVRVRRAVGSTPPVNQAGPQVFTASQTSATDHDVQPSTTYSYSVFVSIKGQWSAPVSTTVTTGAQP